MALSDPPAADDRVLPPDLEAPRCRECITHPVLSPNARQAVACSECLRALAVFAEHDHRGIPCAGGPASGHYTGFYGISRHPESVKDPPGLPGATPAEAVKLCRLCCAGEAEVCTEHLLLGALEYRRQIRPEDAVLR